MGTLAFGFAATQASATCARLTPRRAATSRTRRAYFDVNLVTVEILIEIVGCARSAGIAREESARKRTEGSDAYTLVATVGKHLPLLFAIEQVVLALHVDEPCPAMLRGHTVHLRKLPGIHGGGTKITDLAGPHGLVQRLHSLFDRRVCVIGVDHIEIDIIGAHPLQGPVD